MQEGSLFSTSSPAFIVCRFLWFLFFFFLMMAILIEGFPDSSIGKNLPAMRETWVRSLAWEDLLKKGKAMHSSILAWRIPHTV